MEEAATAQSMPDHAGVGYLQVLRTLHEVLQPRNYFEIGSFTGQSLALADCASLAVNPDFLFEDAALLGDKVQLAFLDGMHRCEFLLHDFINTERHCAPNSIIALHDCVPVEEP